MTTTTPSTIEFNQERKHFNKPTVVRMEQYWIERARYNLEDFILYMSDGMMPPGDHHKEWIEAILNPYKKRINIFAYPGSGKTNLLINILGWYIGRQPWLTHLISSVSEEQAKERLSNLREMVELSERYLNVFPWIQKPPKGSRPNDTTKLNIYASQWGIEQEGFLDWAGFRRRISQLPFGSLRDHTCFAAGITSRTIIGKRITGLFVIDDPHDENNSATTDLRFKVFNFVQRTVLGRLTGPHAKIAIISNRWAEDDLAGRVAELKRRDGRPMWHTINTPIRKPDGTPTWPQVHDEDYIQELADSLDGEDSPVFQMVYMNNPSAASGGEFAFDMFKRALPDPIPEFKEIVISCDFASTENKDSDYTVYTAMGRFQVDSVKWGVCVLDIRRFKRKRISDKIDLLIEFYDEIQDRYGVDIVLMENRDSMPEQQALESERPDIKVEIVSTKGDKPTRLKPVMNKMQVGLIFFNTEMALWQVMANEFMSFPKGKHDDIVDTISLPFQRPHWSYKRNIVKRRKVRSPFML